MSGWWRCCGDGNSFWLLEAAWRPPLSLRPWESGSLSGGVKARFRDAAFFAIVSIWLVSGTSSGGVTESVYFGGSRGEMRLGRPYGAVLFLYWRHPALETPG